MTPVVFTDLDGTLLNSHDYRCDEAIPTLTLLQHQNIPIIPVTSKTRAEVEPLLKDLHLQGPFIVENGSGVFIHPDDERFDLSDTQPQQGYRLKQFGCSYPQARSALSQLSQHLDLTLQGFGDLTVPQLTALTGLAPHAAQQAQTRDFSEPFITPRDRPHQTIQQAVSDLGFRIVVGDRFSHLIGPQASKGTAVRWLLQQFHHSPPSPTHPRSRQQSQRPRPARSRRSPHHHPQQQRTHSPRPPTSRRPNCPPRWRPRLGRCDRPLACPPNPLRRQLPKAIDHRPRRHIIIHLHISRLRQLHQQPFRLIKR